MSHRRKELTVIRFTPVRMYRPRSKTRQWLTPSSAYGPQLGARMGLSHTQQNLVGLAGNGISTFPCSHCHRSDSLDRTPFSSVISWDIRHRSSSWQTYRCAWPEIIPRHRLHCLVYRISRHKDDLRYWAHRGSRTSINRRCHSISHLRLLNWGRECRRWSQFTQYRRKKLSGTSCE